MQKLEETKMHIKKLMNAFTLDVLCGVEPISLGTIILMMH